MPDITYANKLISVRLIVEAHASASSAHVIPSAEMGRFYPLYIRRSDGKLEIVSRTTKRKERNEPTPEQLDQKPDKHGVADYYREVPLDEVKSLDWRRKLGGMLARELAWKDQTGQTGKSKY